jgi:hypothetical protein
MPKKTQVTDDVDIIVSGLNLIQKGIKDTNTDLVVQGFNLITGKNLKWIVKKPKSKVDLIREKLSKDVEDTEDDQSDVNKVTKEPEVSENELVEKKSGGMIVISTAEDIDEIKANEKKAARNNMPPAPKRTGPPKDTTHLDPNKDVVRFDNSNTPPHKRKKNDEE